MPLLLLDLSVVVCVCVYSWQILLPSSRTCFVVLCARSRPSHTSVKEGMFVYAHVANPPAIQPDTLCHFLRMLPPLSHITSSKEGDPKDDTALPHLTKLP